MSWLIGVLLWGMLFPFVGGPPPLSEPTRVRVGMLFLREGMVKTEVIALLGLERCLSVGWGNLLGHSDEYFIGPNHKLRLSYRYDFARDRDVLEEAMLVRGKKRVAFVTFRKKDKEPQQVGIDPELLKQALDYFEQRVEGRHRPGTAPKKKGPQGLSSLVSPRGTINEFYDPIPFRRKGNKRPAIVERMGKDRKADDKGARIVDIEGIDPELLKQAIDALQGRTAPKKKGPGGK
jgi:hypothetical protein